MQKMANEENFDPVNSIDKLVERQLNARQAAGAPQQPAGPSAQPSQKLEETISDYDSSSRAAAEKLKALGGDRNLTREGLEDKFRELGIDWRDYSVCPADYVKSGEQKGTHYIGPADKKHVNPGAIPPGLLTRLADMQLCPAHSKPPVYEPTKTTPATETPGAATATAHQGQLEQKASGIYMVERFVVPAKLQNAEEVNLVLGIVKAPYEVIPDAPVGFGQFRFVKPGYSDNDKAISEARDIIPRLDNLITALRGLRTKEQLQAALQIVTQKAYETFKTRQPQ